MDENQKNTNNQNNTYIQNTKDILSESGVEIVNQEPKKEVYRESVGDIIKNALNQEEIKKSDSFQDGNINQINLDEESINPPTKTFQESKKEDYDIKDLEKAFIKETTGMNENLETEDLELKLKHLNEKINTLEKEEKIKVEKELEELKKEKEDIEKGLQKIKEYENLKEKISEELEKLQKSEDLKNEVSKETEEIEEKIS